MSISVTAHFHSVPDGSTFSVCTWIINLPLLEIHVPLGWSIYIASLIFTTVLQARYWFVLETRTQFQKTYYCSKLESSRVRFKYRSNFKALEIFLLCTPASYISYAEYKFQFKPSPASTSSALELACQSPLWASVPSCTFTGLKWAMMEIFTPQKLANTTTNQCFSER